MRTSMRTHSLRKKIEKTELGEGRRRSKRNAESSRRMGGRITATIMRKLDSVGKSRGGPRRKHLGCLTAESNRNGKSSILHYPSLKRSAVPDIGKKEMPN